MTEHKTMDGHVFTPSLQDMSLKRFRMRYCPQTNGYYLHWDNKLSQHLARIQGLENGVHNMFGVQRFVTAESNMSYISNEQLEIPETTTKDSCMTPVEKTDSQNSGCYTLPPSISWKFDFREFGLAIKNIKIKACVKQDTEEYGLVYPEDIDSEPVTFTIAGDEDSYIDEQIYLGDYYTDIPVLKGCKSVTLTAHLHPTKGSIFFLPSSNQRFETPLDIVINLMCPKREEWPFVGEILLGMKFNESGASESLKDKPDITVDCGLMGGQLQVHVVEGAGLVREGTKKAFNSFVKCRFLPDQNNTTHKQTSPKHNAYPTWTKEFIFAGIDKYDLTHGGIELLVYDHRKFLSNTLIGGIRISHPQRVTNDPAHRFSTGGTLPITRPLSRECSPVSTPRTPVPSRAMFLDIVNTRSMSISQPDLLSIDSDDRTPHVQMATMNRPGNTPVSPVASPLLRRVPVFVPHGRDSIGSTSSPFGSPKVVRRYHKSPKMSVTLPFSPFDKMSSDEVMHWWMDSTVNEITHWKKIINNPGEWIYCWHIIRPKITPA